MAGRAQGLAEKFHCADHLATGIVDCSRTDLDRDPVTVPMAQYDIIPAPYRPT